MKSLHRMTEAKEIIRLKAQKEDKRMRKSLFGGKGVRVIEKALAGFALHWGF